jgi:hypothetical protein
MDIVRNSDGTLLMPVAAERRRPSDDGDGTGNDPEPVDSEPTTRLLNPGEGGYD